MPEEIGVYNNVIRLMYGQVKIAELKARANVEVHLKFNDNGIEYDAYFYAGSIVNTTNTLRSSFDFALFEVPTGIVSHEIN